MKLAERNDSLPIYDPACAEPRRLRESMQVVEILEEIRELAQRLQLTVSESLTHTKVLDRYGEVVVELQSVEFLVLPAVAWSRVLEAVKKLEQHEG